MDNDDPFDPVEFYSDDPLPPSSSTQTNGNETKSSLLLRRSVRPKPAAESLISSPPAIKFYGSTVIRKVVLKRGREKEKEKEKIVKNENGKPSKHTSKSTGSDSSVNSTSSTGNNAGNLLASQNQILKLKLPPLTPSSSKSSSKENLQKNLKVVKLMMPDILADTEKATESQSHKHTGALVNEDVCSACDGLGNFICCDSCPRSFHFTCAEPPLDPRNVPEDDWFCCECRHQKSEKGKQQEKQQKLQIAEASIWDLLIEKVDRVNPKCFVMPRRFRYQAKEEDLQKLVNGQLTLKTSKSTEDSNISKISAKAAATNTEIVINDSIKLDHCNLKAPNISEQKSSTGYCHCCGRFGLTRTALIRSASSPEDGNVPADPRYHRPILSCSICPLYWHLDCLDPPMASFPAGSSEPSWTCPIHFTTEKCLALDLAEALVQATLLLPESAILREFAHKLNRTQQQQAEAEEPDEEEEFYGISDCINVPEHVKRVY